MSPGSVTPFRASLHSSPQSQQAPRPHPASYSVPAVHVQHRRLCPPTCGQLQCFISTPEGLCCVFYFAQTHTVSGVLRTNNKALTSQRLSVLLDSGSLVVTSHLCRSSSKKKTQLSVALKRFDVQPHSGSILSVHQCLAHPSVSPLIAFVHYTLSNISLPNRHAGVSKGEISLVTRYTSSAA